MTTHRPLLKRRSAILRPLLALWLLALAPMLACAAPWNRTAPTPVPDAAPDATAATPEAAVDATPPVAPAVPAARMTFVDILPSAPASFNPVLTTLAADLALQKTFLPSLVELDPVSGGVRPALAADWAWGDGNRTLTLTLRSGFAWSDGAPLTSRDAAFTLGAVANPEVQSPWAPQFAAIEQVSLPEPDTLVIRQRAPDCALLPLLRLPLLPSHLFAADYSDLRSAAWNATPAVGAGPFVFGGQAATGELTLAANAAWPTPPVALTNLIALWDADPLNRLRAVAQGGHRAWGAPAVPPAGALDDPAAVEIQPVPADGMSMLVMNQADPSAPQAGVTANGVLNPQTPHPVLAELNVREAIARGVDWSTLVQTAYGAPTPPQQVWIPPALAWAQDPTATLPPYDPAAARTLLDQAGWADAAGDGLRERGDQLLQLTLITNDDNPQRTALANAAGAALRTLGFDVRVESLPFATAQEAVQGQRYDLAIVGWEGLGPDPAFADLWHSRGDQPGSGPNITSYQNPALDALLDEARTLPGCDEAARAERYRVVQQQLVADLPAIPLGAQVLYQAVQPGWQGVPASVWSPYAGIEGWLPPAATP